MGSEHLAQSRGRSCKAWLAGPSSHILVLSGGYGFAQLRFASASLLKRLQTGLRAVCNKEGRLLGCLHTQALFLLDTRLSRSLSLGTRMVLLFITGLKLTEKNQTLS